MKKNLILFLLFNVYFIFSQNSENIDKIKLTYSIGGSSWGKNGIYSRIEIIELAKTENGDFKISNQLKINEKVDGKVFSKDSITINSSDFKIILKDKINYLLVSLNTNKENFTEEFLKQNFTKPNKNEVLKIAKEIGCKSYLKNNYDEKSDTEKKYSEIREFKYFDEYLKLNKPITSEFSLTMDGWNILRIITFSKEETKSYNLDFSKNCGQPISINHIEINEKEKKLNILDYKTSSIINLNVNLILLEILPENTKLSTQLNLNKIRNNYVNWFLENKRSEFKY
ncbi:hypothetical protein [Flavobacterium sp.]|uniref:hypothetical protein n=1 Tax=Flavobacterium sp. TaxID=239 RepID=UPI003752AABA